MQWKKREPGTGEWAAGRPPLPDWVGDRLPAVRFIRVWAASATGVSPEREIVVTSAGHGRGVAVPVEKVLFVEPVVAVARLVLSLSIGAFSAFHLSGKWGT